MLDPKQLTNFFLFLLVEEIGLEDSVFLSRLIEYDEAGHGVVRFLVCGSEWRNRVILSIEEGDCLPGEFVWYLDLIHFLESWKVLIGQLLLIGVQHTAFIGLEKKDQILIEHLRWVDSLLGQNEQIDVNDLVLDSLKHKLPVQMILVQTKVFQEKLHVLSRPLLLLHQSDLLVHVVEGDSELPLQMPLADRLGMSVDRLHLCTHWGKHSEDVLETSGLDDGK